MLTGSFPYMTLETMAHLSDNAIVVAVRQPGPRQRVR